MRLEGNIRKRRMSAQAIFDSPVKIGNESKIMTPPNYLRWSLKHEIEITNSRILAKI